MSEEFKVIDTQEAFDSAIKSRLERNTKTVTEEVTKKFEGYLSPEDFSKKTESFTKQIAGLNEKIKGDMIEQIVVFDVNRSLNPRIPGYISKIRYDKVVLMADADVDGAHIRTLLLTFFFRYMRPLIEKGHIYIAQPPLYRVTKGKTHIYCNTDAELAKAMEEVGGEADNIQRYKGLGEMDSEQLWDTTMNPATRTMLKVSITDAIEADKIFSVLMGDSVEPRREFIQQNAHSVTNLDI